MSFRPSLSSSHNRMRLPLSSGAAAGLTSSVLIIGGVGWVLLRGPSPSTAVASENLHAAEAPSLDSAPGDELAHAAPHPSEQDDAASELPAASPRSDHEPTVAEFPPVPAGLSDAPAVTVELTTRVAQPSGRVLQRKTATRTVDRLHVQLDGGQQEWLFVRNLVDPRRVSATLVDHATHTLVEYDESELRMAGLGRGWADVAALGVNPEWLTAPSRVDAQVETRFDQTFAAYATDNDSPVHDLWWSDELALPLRFSIGRPKAVTVVELTSLERTVVDRDRLVDPAVRYPNYAIMDVADYREKHHEHADAGGSGSSTVARSTPGSGSGSHSH